LNPIAEEAQEAQLEIEGRGIVLWERKKQATQDAKRYLKLFKKHVHHNNTHYSVTATNMVILINHTTGGINENIVNFRYSAGHVKALYCLLVTLNYNMDNVLEYINEHKFQPFPDNEYFQHQTPEPQEALRSQFTQVSGKWQ
jgi:hypothetical protein